MESSLREIEQREKMRKEKKHIETMIKYERAKICPKCGELMRYAFGVDRGQVRRHRVLRLMKILMEQVRDVLLQSV